MKTINLQDYYPEIYKQDEYTQVPDEVLETLLAAKRTNANYLRRLFYHKAHYSLDQGDGIETAAVHKEQDSASRRPDTPGLLLWGHAGERGKYGSIKTYINSVENENRF